MEYGSEFSILGADWAFIHFVENNGMAFGFSFGGKAGKLTLSLFRIGAVIFLLYYLVRLIKADYSIGLLASFSLIFAGAVGNIIDSSVYGVIFSESAYHGGTAKLFPKEGGYAGFLHGKVVDMLYFPIIDMYWPDWMPLVGGNRFQFFKPVFNIADATISTGIISLFLFHRSFFKSHNEDLSKKVESEPNMTS